MRVYVMTGRTFLIRCDRTLNGCGRYFWRKYPCNPDPMRPYICPFCKTTKTVCTSALEQLTYVHKIKPEVPA